MRVEHIYRYPVKGLTPEALEDVALSAGQCLPHDRRFALAQGDAPWDAAAPGWLPKRNFGCLAVNARLAALHSAFDPSSLHALEAATGRQLDERRFRANIYFSGAAPWAEFDWLGQEIQLGGARLKVFRRIIRCPATEVNPDTAERDAEPPRLLREHFGHADLGVYAEVLDGGRVAVGDALEPLQGDLLH